ncbi:MAG: glycoside hydrolase family 47 protein [Ignavibacteriaceae bacterium]
MSKHKSFLVFFFLLVSLIFSHSFAQTQNNIENIDSTNGNYLTCSKYVASGTIDKSQIVDEIKQEFLFCWNNYKKYAWGYDELNPLSRTGSNWYSSSFLMTPVDALDTMILMGLKSEADSARQLIDTKLSFDKDVYVSNFEFTIRFLGGLISSYQLTGDQKLLSLAKDLANRELPAFRKSPTGMPYGDVNLKTGAVRRPNTNPAEIGTMLIEFGTLSKLTGDTIYYNVAKRALLKLYSLRSKIGLVGSGINIETGTWTNSDCSVSGGIDSYFEYLIKCSLLFKDKDCTEMWQSTINSINKYLYDSTSTGVWYGHVDMNTGKRTSTQFGSLDAFFPDPLCLDGEIQRAGELEESCYKMWNRYGIEPEQFNYSTMTETTPGYYLRPEIVESAYYLYHYTQDPRYLVMGKTFFDDLEKYCRTNNGYVQLQSVVTHQQTDGMPSYFLAETLKYFYLLFAPPETLNFDKVIFNTEAHPIQKTWSSSDTTAINNCNFNLYQNYPNPFNLGTIVQYDLPKSAHVILKIYDEIGQCVETLVDNDMTAGTHKVQFSAAGLASGVYFYQFKADDFVLSNKMVYLK